MAGKARWTDCCGARFGLDFADDKNQINPIMKISARNIIPGKVTSLKKGPVSASVTIEIAPGIEIVSSITAESAAGLKLKKGQKAYAIIKASSVIIGAD
jgi:molybdopterin-binding protein